MFLNPPLEELTHVLVDTYAQKRIQGILKKLYRFKRITETEYLQAIEDLKSQPWANGSNDLEVGEEDLVDDLSLEPSDSQISDEENETE